MAQQVITAALRPGAALQGAAVVPNLGRFGALHCRCPFAARLLVQSAAVVGKERDGGRLRRLSCEVFGEEVVEAFKAFEAKEPGGRRAKGMSLFIISAV